MKKILLVAFAAISFANVNAQLILNESFNGFTNGSLVGKGSPVWLPFLVTGTNPDVTVASANPLVHPTLTYTAGGGQQYVSIFRGSNGNINGDGRSTSQFFTDSVKANTAGQATNTFFYSFLVRVNAASTTTDNANYNIALRRFNGTTENESVGRFVINKMLPSNNARFGIAASHNLGSQTFADTVKTSSDPNEVYLILIRFDMIGGAADKQYMWINPDLSVMPTIASADATSTSNSANNDFGDRLDCLMILQRNTSNKPLADIDGIKVSVGQTPESAFASLNTTIPQPQQLVNENFTGYNLTSVNGQGTPAWILYPSSETPDLTVAATSQLLYDTYPAGGNYLSAVNYSFGKGRSSQKPFPYPIRNHDIDFSPPQTIFYSFLVRVSDAVNALDNENYSVALRNLAGDNGTFSVGRFSISKKADETLVFGASVSGAVDTVEINRFNPNEVFLIVMRYDVIADADDKVYMWINPTLTAEPTIATANATQTGVGSFGAQLDALMVFNRDVAARPTAQFDGFRVATGENSAEAFTNLQVPPNSGTLPVKLTNFSAGKSNNGATLSWTGNETGLARYEIEKSSDGRSFNKIGTVTATSAKTYSFADPILADGNNFYRLKMVDADGKSAYSMILNVKNSASVSIEVFPNPVKNTMVIQHPQSASSASVKVFNTSGRLVKEMAVARNQVSTTFDVSDLAVGVYYVQYKGNSVTQTTKVVKQ